MSNNVTVSLSDIKGLFLEITKWQQINSKTKTIAEQYNEHRRTNEYQDKSVLFIIVILVAYSTLILCIMIRYINKGNRHHKEEELHQQFLATTKHLAKQKEKQCMIERHSFQILRLAYIQKQASIDIAPTQIHKNVPVIIEEAPTDDSVSAIGTHESCESNEKSVLVVIHSPQETLL